MQLKLSNNMITGNLAGKPIHCRVRMGPGTGSPAPGEYVVPAPESDPIYGYTAMVVPLRPGSIGVAQGLHFKVPGAQTAIKFAYAPASKVNTPGLGSSAGIFKAPGLTSSAGGGAMESAGGAGAEAQSLTKQVLVLSDKPIAGRNCLIVSLGFADLMLGLQATAGATLTVL